MTRTEFIHQAVASMCANPRFFLEDGTWLKRDSNDESLAGNMVDMAEILANVLERQGHQFAEE